MKFKIKQAALQEPEEKTIEASLVVDGDGDLVLKINGHTLLWISARDGVLYRYSASINSLSGLGFLLNRWGQICITDEKQENEGSYR